MLNEAYSTFGFTKKGFLLLTFVIVIPLYTFCGWMSRLQFTNPPTFYRPTNISHPSNITTVLLWSWPFGGRFNLGGDVCWNQYQIPNCLLVAQRNLFSTADVVVFHNRELIQGEKLPLALKRPLGQRWAWMSLESPAHNGNVKKYANIFNLTVTYRRDADVTAPYGKIVPNPDPGTHLESDIMENKTTLACWVVSNYRGTHRRSKVYQQLKTIIPIKVFGRWSGNPLKSSDLLPTLRRCYFYLAFENSEAKDYITEKLWKNAYLAGAVPVVLGTTVEDYRAVAPPHSFIHVDEFASLKDLGSYLKELSQDERRYREYFNWRKDWKVEILSSWSQRLCWICPKYKSLPRYKVYTDLEQWRYKEY